MIKPELAIRCDHNHVRREEHFGESLLIHRKGAMPADAGLPGVIPGSMGTLSLHVEGRGCAESLRSSAHGAGRLFSRRAARDRFTRSDLRRQMDGIWFEPRLTESLREESPKSYKDVRAVMRAQAELVKVVRTLRPLLVYKGR
jgi:tRNA-splicing ligase RtcB